MRYRMTLVPLLGVALLSLVAFAHASPPDQTWLPGLYDAADFDDVIDLIVSLSGVAPDSPGDALQRGPVATAAIRAVEPGHLPPRLHLSSDTRGPPSS